MMPAQEVEAYVHIEDNRDFQDGTAASATFSFAIHFLLQK
jgi:hypothetical protein